MHRFNLENFLIYNIYSYTYICIAFAVELKLQGSGSWFPPTTLKSNLLTTMRVRKHALVRGGMGAGGNKLLVVIMEHTKIKLSQENEFSLFDLCWLQAVYLCFSLCWFKSEENTHTHMQQTYKVWIIESDLARFVFFCLKRCRIKIFQYQCWLLDKILIKEREKRRGKCIKEKRRKKLCFWIPLCSDTMDYLIGYIIKRSLTHPFDENVTMVV